MIRHHRTQMATILTALTLFVTPAATFAQTLVSPREADRIGLRSYWSLDLDTRSGEIIDRLTVLDENIYAFTPENFLRVVHVDTGIVRWSTNVAQPGHRVLGPTHAEANTYFTSQGGVQIYNRRTGRAAPDRRILEGRIIEAIHDSATITIGSLHGVTPGLEMEVYNLESSGRGRKIADLKITVVKQRRASGVLRRTGPDSHVDSGDVVTAKTVLPLNHVPLPFAPSSAALSDNAFIYYGASNSRFYKLTILDGFRDWQIQTEGQISATPVIYRGDLFLASQDGSVISMLTERKRANWIFNTNGAVFHSPAVGDAGVFVSCSDRSVYAITRQRGERKWRRQFGSMEIGAPMLVGDTLYISAPGDGFYALNAADGETRWSRKDDMRMLAVHDGVAFIASGPATNPKNGKIIPGIEIEKVDAASGKSLGHLSAPQAVFAAGSPDPMTIVLADQTGRLQCLRSSDYPLLTPDKIAAVLAADQEALTGRSVKETNLKLTLEDEKKTTDDPFRSSSGTKPVGGRNLVEVEDNN